ncbi:MAG: N-acetyltransferase family protein [Hyphomicrobiales bacterium]
MNATPTVIRPATDLDIPAILSIYNQAVRGTTAIWNNQEVDLENRMQWFNERSTSGYPVFVALDDAGVVGYGSYGTFRPFEGFARTVENSVYVAPNAQGKGVGKLLLEALLQSAHESNIHVMVAGIEAGNTSSLELHKKFGFVETGRMPEVGFKFGRYLELVFLQKQISSQGS